MLLDLSFQAAPPDQALTLSEDQIRHYNQHGYVQPMDLLLEAEVVSLRRYVDGLMSDMGESGAYGINCYQARLSGLWDIANHPKLLDYVQDIIGPNIVCWASAILSKKPLDERQVPWHQDASFWKLTPARTVTVWLAIDDANESNSAMRFLPGSHKNGVIATQAAGENSVFHKETANTQTLGDPFTNVLKAGQISLHADMLVHGSLANVSDKRRCALTLRYCPPEVTIVDKEWAVGVEAVVCRGSADGSDWVHHPRPENNDILKTSSPHVVGNN